MIRFWITFRWRGNCTPWCKSIDYKIRIYKQPMGRLSVHLPCISCGQPSHSHKIRVNTVSYQTPRVHARRALARSFSQFQQLCPLLFSWQLRLSSLMHQHPAWIVKAHCRVNVNEDPSVTKCTSWFINQKMHSRTLTSRKNALTWTWQEG